MPRKVRIDAPGALHHIIARGIERRKIFFDSADRDIFLKRLWVKISENGKKLGHGYGYPAKIATLLKLFSQYLKPKPYCSFALTPAPDSKSFAAFSPGDA